MSKHEGTALGMVPKLASWCIRCAQTVGAPCADHAKGEYAGPEAYKPSEWVLSVVGSAYSGWDGRQYRCTGYDPRSGFWMQSTDAKGAVRLTCVSERAIGRTFKPVPAVETSTL